MPTRSPSLIRGIAVGAIAGIAATLVMDQFLALISAGGKELARQKKLAEGESAWAIAHEQAAEDQQSAQQEGSTEKVAHKLAESAGYLLPSDQKKSAGQAVHFTFGTLVGIVYGAAAEHLPDITTGAGIAFGTVLFLAADELAVPALQLAPPPTEARVSDQLTHWAAHVVYGATLDLSRSLLRRLI